MDKPMKNERVDEDWIHGTANMIAQKIIKEVNPHNTPTIGQVNLLYDELKQLLQSKPKVTREWVFSLIDDVRIHLELNKTKSPVRRDMAIAEVIENRLKE